MIKIHPSPTADTRTCDWSKVTRETLLASSEQHIRDIRAGLAFFAEKLAEAGVRHDHDKITAIDHFHADFRSGFAQTGWWDNHRKVNRHHLTEADGIPADVNLVDVLDFITDCVMAGMARSGSVRPLTIDPAVLQRAFENTAALLCANVEVAPLPAPSAAPARETHGTVAVFSAVARREITAEQGAELLASPPSDAGTETGGGR
jgi:hypothetical protein